MDLEVRMSNLEISHKRRRLSGIVRVLPGTYGNETCTTEETPISNLHSELPAESQTCTQSKSPSSPGLLTSPEMQTDVDVELRRSGRRRTMNKIEPSTSTGSLFKNIDNAKDLKSLKKIYLDKRVRKTCPSLETIFEVPTDEKVMSTRKFRRLISFQELQKNKVKKRPLKAKSVVASYNKTKKKNKVTMDALMQKLHDIDSETD